jgi:hypothetical protein
MPETNTRVLNLWSGPGAGKSTTAAGLFFLMKSAGMKCELVTEYAKDKTYEEAWGTIADQWYITGKQQRRLRRLLGQVDWVVTDSPLPVGLLYTAAPFNQPWFEGAIWNLFDTFDNVNVFIERTKPYQKYGRSQSEDEARKLDRRLHELGSDRIDLYVPGDSTAPQAIFDHLFKSV